MRLRSFGEAEPAIPMQLKAYLTAYRHISLQLDLGQKKEAIGLSHRQVMPRNTEWA